MEHTEATMPTKEEKTMTEKRGKEKPEDKEKK